MCNNILINVSILLLLIDWKANHYAWPIIEKVLTLRIKIEKYFSVSLIRVCIIDTDKPNSNCIMSLKKTLSTLILFITITSFSQNSVWYFGTYDVIGGKKSFGLDFTSGSPVQRNGESAIGYYESVSVVSDNSGNVLYYTDGVKLFDGSHKTMVGVPGYSPSSPTAGELKGPKDGSSGTSVQGAYSVLKPGSQTEYYLFTSQGIDGAANGFRVNTIDMSLPGNGTVSSPLGEVVTADSLLLNTGSELMTAYGNCGSDSIWVVTHSPNSYDFVRVLITSGGIRSVTKQTMPTPNQEGLGFSMAPGRGSMDINNDGTKLIFTAMNNAGAFILDFNEHTGEVSNPLEIRVPSGIGSGTYPFTGYGSEFSPDGNFAYFCSIQAVWGIDGIWQYNVNDSTIMTKIPGSSGNFAEIITGVDDKLYVGKVRQENKMTVGVIDQPNNPVGSIGFDEDAIVFPALGGNAAISYAMPQGYFCPLNPCKIDILSENKCIDDGNIQITAIPTGGTFGGGDYVNSSGVFNPVKAGTGVHWVTYDAGCDKPDSTQVTVINCCPDISPDLGVSRKICKEQTFTLDAGIGLETYEWKENGIVMSETGPTISADSGTYIVNVTNGDGCTGTDTIEIENYQVQNMFLGPDKFHCKGIPVKLNAGLFDSWAWTPNGEISQEITVTLAGTYGVTAIDDNGCNNTDEIIIEESELPEPKIIGNTVVCSDSSTQLAGVRGAGGDLIWSGITSFTNPLSVTTGGTYTLIETDSNGCVGSVDHIVNLEELPNVEIGGSHKICFSQGNKTLNAFGGGTNETYLWSNNTTNSTLNVTDSSIVSVIVTSQNGCIAYDTAIIDTVPLPTVDLGNDTFYCEADSFLLDAGSGFSNYAWTPNVGSSQVIFATSATKYSVIVTDTNGCLGTAEVNISEKPLPFVNLGGDTTICKTDSISLDATHLDAVSYLWTPTLKPTAVIKVSSLPETYKVTLTDAFGCIFTADKTISEDVPPNIYLGSNDTICDDLTKKLEIIPGYAYQWYLDGNIMGNTSNTINADSGTYVGTLTTVFGCESRDTIILYNYQLPSLNMSDSLEFCELDSVQLDAGNSTSTYYWVPTGETNQTIWAKQAGEFKVVITDTNSCINSGSTTVIENLLPPVNLGANDSACIGLSITLDASATNGVKYTWSDGYDEAIYTITNPDTLSVIVEDAIGCINYDTIEIKQLQQLILTLSDTTSRCANDILNLNAGDFSEGEYLWTLPDGSTDNAQIISMSDSGWYVINVTDKYNCKGSDSLYGIIIPIPNIDLGPDTFFCSRGKDTYTIEMKFSELIPGVVSWIPEDNNSSNENLFYATQAPATIIGIFEDTLNCSNSDTVELTEFCEPTIFTMPNIFVPGGTQNPTFHPIEVEDDTYVDFVNNILTSKFEVYNRWGVKMFQSVDLLPRWNGMYENRKAASGTYYWIFSYTDSSLKEYKLNGFTQLIQMR